MSQFNFPRINFHGSVLLDVATANNGRFHPLKVYDQNAALPYFPPRVYLLKDQVAYVKLTWPQFPVISDGEEFYVEITPISNADIFIEWSKCNIGTYDKDKQFLEFYLYTFLSDNGITKDSPNWIQPGYWNYYGDMSVYTEDVRITGVQLPNGNGVSTWSPGNTNGCPPILSQILGTSLSFHTDFFAEDPRSSAVFCDVDSEGQTCTQLFYGKAGIYDDSNGQQRTFFNGKPCKSTFNWMTLSKMLNWMDKSLMPMSGATYFYSTIDLTNTDSTSNNYNDPELQALFNQYAGQNVTALSMKISVHEVYEVHNPDYGKMPTTPMGNNQTKVPKNPARVAFSGSICPYVDGDMKTNTIARILKNPPSVNIPIDNTDNKIKPPTVKEGLKFVPNKLKVPTSVQLPPSFLHHDQINNIISLDMINSIPEYGMDLGVPYPYGGDTSIPPFTKFENYDLGVISLYFMQRGSSIPSLIGSISHSEHYNYERFISIGGVFNFPTKPGVDFTNGTFYLSTPTQKIAVEDEYLILSDQQGSYAEQNQSSNEGYMSDGLPKGPIFIRAFKNGIPIKKEEPCQGWVQTINLAEESKSQMPISIYDGMPFSYPVDKPGCCMYGFAATTSQLMPGDWSKLEYFLSNGYFITTRVLEYSTKLQNLLAQSSITFDDIYENVLVNYHTVLPIMAVILPFTEETWREPWVLRRMLASIAETSWNGPMYMPVTRELSAQQRQLLQKWAYQILGNENQEA
ncbi:hypothetical protein SAMN04488009_1543 [Maribacter sedimenticola]|uniref:L-lysine 6-oxidase n=1 Tax=Maribacter sedimenticola TaxID=228956 RepID=A0ABY1SFH1_9FLAO|nr:hypothetical protein [Maribacter sedimenticola]SNR41908.1 hypothetical protein SAMN04488009_1543 [Maribacter sedimenticola]